MESQWGYNLQCNVIDNLLIMNVVFSQQYHCNMTRNKKRSHETVSLRVLRRGAYNLQ